MGKKERRGRNENKNKSALIVHRQREQGTWERAADWLEIPPLPYVTEKISWMLEKETRSLALLSRPCSHVLHWASFISLSVHLSLCVVFVFCRWLGQPLS